MGVLSNPSQVVAEQQLEEKFNAFCSAAEEALETMAEAAEENALFLPVANDNDSTMLDLQGGAVSSDSPAGGSPDSTRAAATPPLPDDVFAPLPAGTVAAGASSSSSASAVPPSDVAELRAGLKLELRRSLQE